MCVNAVEMEEEKDHFYLEFSVKLFQFMSMWPDNKRTCKIIKEHYILMVIMLSTLPIKADFALQFYDDNYSLTTLIEAVIAASALYSVIYISICFMIKKSEIKMLVENLKIFEHYLPQTIIEETENIAKFFTKIFLSYGVVGNIFYAMLPILQYNTCESQKTTHMEKYGIPCGLIARYVLPFKFDISPLSEIIMIEEAFVCTLGTFIVMSVTMLICGILTHICANLTYLRKMILNVTNLQDPVEIERQVGKCIRYHTAIIEYSDKVNDAFSFMMLVHITWTSFIISVLGFKIIIETNYSNSIRFVMHLTGWVGMLFLICVYGQILMNKSLDISTAVYELKWYEKSTYTRKALVLILLRSQRPLTLKAAGMNVMSLPTFLGSLDISTAVYELKWYEKSTYTRKALVLILLRSQRPLTLKAAGMNVMSLPTFLGVLSTAYSYFTLLLKLKP